MVIMYGSEDLFQMQPMKMQIKSFVGITKHAKKLMKENSQKDYTQDYAYDDKSDISKIELKTGEEKTVTLKFKNTGTEEWNANTYLTVSSGSRDNGLVEFPDEIGIRITNADNGTKK